MNKNPEVDSWFAESKPPAEDAMRRVRDIILGADSRVAEYVKYGTVQFAFEGDMANFVQHRKKTVSLMFNRGARIPGNLPNLEGDGPSARFMHFADVADVEAKADDLRRVVAAWCDPDTRR
ncbi:MAG: DUF1801 domain-containing protein [Candidatus Dormiibacterota bacterium]